VTKIVSEICLIEGVGDKYAEQEFFVPDDFWEFDYKFNKSQLKNKENSKEDRNKLIPINEKAVVVKNPSSLKNIAPAVRGIIDDKGNVYLSVRGNCIHQTIIDALEKMNLLIVDKLWYRNLPTTFVTIQRFRDTDILAMGESNFYLYNKPGYTATEEEIDNSYSPILEAARIKNPHLYIAFTLIGDLEKNPNPPSVSTIF
jgi:hypothetical protein